MDFLKKHYEKVLLGVVLIGLAVAVGFLPFKIADEKQKLQDLSSQRTHPKVPPLTNLDLTMPESAIKRMGVAALIDFSTTNKVFNPMPWQQAKDNHLIPSMKAGPTAAVVTNITPLYLKMTLDSAIVSSDGSARYLIGVEHEAAPTPDKRKKKQIGAKVGDKTEAFFLRAVNGPPDNPTNVVLELLDTGEKAVVSKEQPFKRVDGYMADLKYEPEKKNWHNKRVGDVLNFNAEDYKVVAITQNEVVLSAPSQKKWTLKSSTAPP